MFFPLLSFVTLVPLTWALEAILLHPFWAVPEEAHWSERARVGFPARTRLVSWAITSTLLVGMAWVLWLGRLTPIGVAIAPGVGVFLVTVLAVARVGRIVAPERPRMTARGLAGMLVLGWGSVLALALAGALAPSPFSAQTWMVVAVTGAVVLAWALGLPIRLASALGLFRPPSAEVAALVSASAARAGIPTPVTLVAELPMANAFALLVARRLVLTKALVEKLDADSLSAVLDHEMGHLREPPATIAVRLASSLALVPLVVVRPVYAAHGVVGAATLLGTTAIVIALAARLRRRLEHAADAHAHAPEEGDTLAEGGPRGLVYARVLERIYEMNGIPAVLRGPLGSHPSLYDRMRAAGAEPSFTRPEPPPRRLAPLVVCFVLAVAALVGSRVALMWVEVAHGERLGVIHLVLATTGGDANAFEQLGYARYLSGDVPGATLAYAAAAELEPDEAEPRALVARLRMMTGDCRGALGAAWDASVVADRTGDERDLQLVRSIRRELESCEPR